MTPHRRPLRATLLFAAAAMAPSGSAAAHPEATPTAQVVRYEVRIALDAGSRDVAGGTAILVHRPEGAPREIRFPRNGLEIGAVRVGDRELRETTWDDELVIPLPEQPGEVWLRVAHRGAPARGLVFGEQYVYSDFFTCRWMVCRDDPGEKAGFALELSVPGAWEVVASGRRVASEALPGGRRRERWIEESPHASYLFGFAAGELARAEEEAEGVELLFLGAGETPETLSRKLEPTAAMLRFFAEKAGLPLPRESYAQVVVPGSEAQEKSSFSILGTRQLDPILEDPSEDWVIAHELAHQWWGNSITCRDWSHFWLNEGLTSFMVAAYKERRWGEAAYDREIDLFEKRREQAAEAGWDVPLAYAGEYPSLGVKRAVVYAKGALFLHALREELGDAAFWTGLRAYTRQHAGGSVESRDFQRAFERATRRDLDALFAAWVHPAPLPVP